MIFIRELPFASDYYSLFYYDWANRSSAFLHSTIASPEKSFRSACLFERRDEFGEMLVGNPARLTDLDAAKLAGPEQAVYLVTSDVQYLRYLLDGVCPQRRLTSPSCDTE